ncbi:MAG: hypothetical protein FWF87_08310 [Synergistaceae bacterium]|nr:hypothetical protein [Synergistaceae bacterium]
MIRKFGLVVLGLALCIFMGSAARAAGSSYIGTYVYSYEYNSDENHYIVLEDVNGKIVGRYYGTSDDFDDAREGYYAGYYVTDMRNLQIKGNVITFEVKLTENDMFSKPVDLKYKSGKQVPKSENPVWENKQLVTYAASSGNNPRKYKGNIANGEIILETGYEPRVFKKNTGNATNGKSLTPMEAYKAVLKNEMAFYSANNNKNYKLSEFDYWNDTDAHPLEVYRFTVVDMDNDGTPEVVLELTTGFDGAFEVLHYEGGTVYGFNFPYRGMLDLSKDGMYLGSNGAYDSCVLKAGAIKDTYKEETVAYSESGQDANGDLTVVAYYIGSSKVTEDEYDALTKSVFDNPAVWHDYNDSSIESAFK